MKSADEHIFRGMSALINPYLSVAGVFEDDLSGVYKPELLFCCVLDVFPRLGIPLKVCNLLASLSLILDLLIECSAASLA